MTTPAPVHGTRATDPIEEPMAQLYARDPSLWSILANMRQTLRSHGTELRVWSVLLVGLTGSQNEYVKGLLHVGYVNAQHTIAAILAGFPR